MRIESSSGRRSCACRRSLYGHDESAALWVGASPGQGMVQDGAQFLYLPLRYVGGQHRLRSVKCPAPLMEFDGYARLHQALGVDDRFIAVRIELRRRNVGGR